MTDFYSEMLAKASSKLGIITGDSDPDKRDRSIPTGLLSVDLLLGNGGFIPGMHTLVGLEQSAKSNIASSTMLNAVAMGVPICVWWDFEGSFDESYVTRFHNSYTSDPRFLFKDEASDIDGITYIHNGIGDKFWKMMRTVVKSLPEKHRMDGVWFQFYVKDPKTDFGKNILASFPEGKKLPKDFEDCEVGTKYWNDAINYWMVRCENGAPQAIFSPDSYKALFYECMADEQEDLNAQLALKARCNSANIESVKAFLRSKGVVLLGINHFIGTIPKNAKAASRMEGGGFALRNQSDARLQTRVLYPGSSDVPGGLQKLLGVPGTGKHLDKAYGDSICGKGKDTYKMFEIMTIKNKVGGSLEKSSVAMALMSEDVIGRARGPDPVFDMAQFLMLTHQGDVGRGKVNIDLDGHPLQGQTLSYAEFKLLVLGDIIRTYGITEDGEPLDGGYQDLHDNDAAYWKLRDKLGIGEDVDTDMRSFARQQIDEGDANQRYKGKGLYVADDDAVLATIDPEGAEEDPETGEVKE